MRGPLTGGGDGVMPLPLPQPAPAILTASVGDAWCGPVLGGRSWVANSLSPCYVETASAALLLSLTAWLLVAGAAAARRAAAAADAAGLLRHVRGLSAFEAGSLLTCGALATLHVAHLGAVVVMGSLRAAPFHWAFQAAGVASWLAALLGSLQVAKGRATLDLRALAVAAGAVYVISVYSYFGWVA